MMGGRDDEVVSCIALRDSFIGDTVVAGCLCAPFSGGVGRRNRPDILIYQSSVEIICSSLTGPVRAFSP